MGFVDGLNRRACVRFVHVPKAPVPAPSSKAQRDARDALGTAITNIILQGGDVDTELATAEDTVNFTMGF